MTDAPRPDRWYSDEQLKAVAAVIYNATDLTPRAADRVAASVLGLNAITPPAPLPEGEATAQALQSAWNSYVGDTGCYPDCFTASKDVKLVADFSRGPFARLVAEHLATHSLPEGVVVLDGKRWRVASVSSAKAGDFAAAVLIPESPDAEEPT